MDAQVKQHGDSIDSVLIVEDSALQRAYVAEVCRQSGIATVYEADNGCKAVELLSTMAPLPALAIVDIEMPGMDGIEFLQELARYGSGIPVIVMSSRDRAIVDTVEQFAQTLGLKLLAAVRKPLTPAKFAGILSQYDGASNQRSSVVPAGAVITPPEQALADAIGRREIRVHYQPTVDMVNVMPRGLEALARWTDAEYGPVRPDVFIPLAERSGHIRALTELVVDQALACAARWNAKGVRFKMAINLSPLVLDDRQLVTSLLDACKRYAIEPQQLVLELTETSVVTHLSHALAALARLRLKGFGLSIDDYGTGFSSLQQLSRIPFSQLKIDRSFVNGASQRHNLQVILKSALTMARQLELYSVAEGIETIGDWRLLQSLGCTIGQGYFIAKPMPEESIGSWLDDFRLRQAELRAPTVA